MRFRVIQLCMWALATFPAFAQGKKVVAVIGSSTAFGLDANPIADSSWVNLAKHYWQGLGEIDTIYNLAVASTTTYDAMPTGFIPPANRDATDPAHNITKAMSFNPDVVFISFPSNDIGFDYTNTEYLFNLRTMADVVTSAGKVCYVCSTQPRNSFNAAEVDSLLKGRDSILAEFNIYGLNFFDPLADPVTHFFNPSLTSGGVHPNNAGHLLLFQVVKNNVVIPGSPLPLTLIHFQAFAGERSILLQWATGNEQDPTTFDLQRSGDGISFESIGHLEGKGNGQEAGYSFNDLQPLRGRNFYRLFISSGTQQTYSQVITVAPFSTGSSGWIGRIFPPNGNQLNIELNLPDGQRVELSLYTATGELIGKQTQGPLARGAIVPMQLPSLAAGLYYISVSSADGHLETRAFSKP